MWPLRTRHRGLRTNPGPARAVPGYDPVQATPQGPPWAIFWTAAAGLLLRFEVVVHNTRRGSYSLGAPKRQVRTKTRDPPHRFRRPGSSLERAAVFFTTAACSGLVSCCHAVMVRTARHGALALAAPSLHPVCTQPAQLRRNVRSLDCVCLTARVSGAASLQRQEDPHWHRELLQLLNRPSSLISRVSRKRRDPDRASVPVLSDRARLDAMVPKRHDCQSQLQFLWS